MSKYVALGMIYFLAGMKHRQLRRAFCMSRWKKQAARMMKLI